MNEDEQGVKTPPAAPASADRGQLLAELRTIEANPSPFHSLSLFIVTLVLFFTAGIVRSDAAEIAILIGVLLFHELGHLAAMKMLGYRDVKIFFVPFLGAAATGKTGNHSAVRSCFVSIMGPLPGVFAALICLVFFALTHEYYAFKTAQIMLMLNVFNMLPIMPLDGGRFIDVLFVRNLIFRFLFALFGVGCFVALAISGEDFFMGFIAFLSLVGAIAGFRHNRVAKRMIGSGMEEKSLEELTANPERFDRLVSDLESEFPKSFQPQANPKAIHAHVASILDTVKFVPAKWPMKILLGGAYSLVLLFSLLLAFFFQVSDYHEKLKITEDDSVISVRYFNGSKSGEIPLDKELYFHGVGYDFATDTNIVEGVYGYSHGYRHGREIRFNFPRDTAGIVYYTMGRLDSVVTMDGGARTRYLPGERPWYKRFTGWVDARSQPRKSYHRFFNR